MTVQPTEADEIDKLDEAIKDNVADEAEADKNVVANEAMMLTGHAWSFRPKPMRLK